MFISNFTPDPVEWMHIGVNGIIPAYKEGEKAHIVEVDESRGNHILSKFSKRGLLQMNFGDDEDAKREQAMKLYRQFWEDQITRFNQHNEDQKEKGNRYAKPTPQLEAKSKEFELELLQPWRIEKKPDVEAMKKLEAENVELKKTVGDLSTQMSEILVLLKTGKEKAPASAGSSDDDIIVQNRKKYKSQSENTFKGWVRNNWDEIPEMPEENRFEIQTKYQDLYQIPFPTEKPE